MSALFGKPLGVVNVGLASFTDSVAAAGAPVARVQWSPPGGDPAIAGALARLMSDASVGAANKTAFAAYLAAEPVLEGVGIAREVVPGLGERMLLHAGPPIDWARMGGAMRGAVIGACLLEGWAQDHGSARAMAGRGEIRFDPCHHHAAVGPMAGIISPSMPVWMLRNVAKGNGAAKGNRAFSNLNEGLGKVLRYGANSPEVIAKLGWMRDTLGPVLAKALAATGPIELKPLMGRALHMGDEMHNRNAASSALLFKRLAAGILKSGVPAAEAAAVIDFLNGNDFFFLNVGMAACKAMLDAAHGVPGSTMVTAMARNGTDFGIRTSGTLERWFTGPAQVPDGLYFPGYGPGDAGRDIGDSAITETAGIGGFAMAAAPAIVQFIGGTPQRALEATRTMRHVTLGANPAFTIPMLEFSGSPAGIDVRKVVDTGIAPIINTGMAHREAGIGQVGAGIVHPPMECFTQALAAAAESAGERAR
jgi:hypothetical protein